MTKIFLFLAAAVLLARILGSSLRSGQRNTSSRGTHGRPDSSLEMKRCEVCGEYFLPSGGSTGAFVCASCRSTARASR